MDTEPTPKEALDLALEVAGSQSELARICGVSQPAVWKWLQVRRVPPQYVLRIEAETGVSRHDLRPDIYPRELPHAPDAFIGVDRGTGHVSFNGRAVSQGLRA